MTFHIQDKDNSPLVGATVKAEGPNISADATTDGGGLATVSLPAILPRYLAVRVHKDGFVPKLITWELNQPSFILPSDFTLKMEKAQTIGGAVENEDGAHKGIPVGGTVTDDQGKPIAGVNVVFGEAGSGSATPPNTTTDATGHFHFGGLSIEPAFHQAPILTFTSPKYAPEMVDPTAFASGQPLNVELKAGKRLAIRFTDQQGHPVKDVTLAADHWPGHRPFGHIRFQSDDDGQIAWDHAPDDPITYAILADSFQSQNLVLRPKHEVQTIQLKRPTVVSGRVLDATTKQPITDYDLVFGTYYPERDPFWSCWARGAALHIGTDSYRYVFESRAVMGSPTAAEPATEGFHRIRIEAPGYEPGVCRPIGNDEESVFIDFQLKPASAIHGVVAAADGSPVKNAQIVIAGPGNAVQIVDGFCRDKWDKQIITTDEHGEYDLPAQEADFPVAIIQPDAGYLTTIYSALKASPNVKLLPGVSWKFVRQRKRIRIRGTSFVTLRRTAFLIRRDASALRSINPVSPRMAWISTGISLPETCESARSDKPWTKAR